MIINIKRIPTTEREFKFTILQTGLHPAFVGRTDVETLSDARVELLIHRIENTVTIKGSVVFSLKFTCARCTETLESDIRIKVDRILSKSKGDREEVEELHHGYYSTEDIDLSEICLENIGLLLPQTFLCSANCKGLCYICGADLNEGDCGCAR